MPQYFYAYHGPKNTVDFNPENGYGVSLEHKQKNTKIGDFVFVIQKSQKRDLFELCGLYTISSHSINKKNKLPFRINLSKTHDIFDPIPIDEEKISQRLPQDKGRENWSNFKKHFCRQGASFKNPLEKEVIEVLEEIIYQKNKTNNTNLKKLTESFNAELMTSANRTSEQRISRISQAKSKPESTLVTVRHFLRNPDIVAEVLFKANGICSECGKEAPFIRHSDGSPYLEVHHKTPLANDGEDTLENTIAVCPNCHRKLHFGQIITME